MAAEFSLKKINNLTETLEIIADIAAIVSVDYKILFQNSKCKEIYGDNLGRNCYEAFAKRKNICDNCACKSVFMHKKAAKNEFSRRDLDGNELFIEIVASPIRNESGDIIASVEIARDVTSRKKIVQEKEKLIQDLQEALSEIKILKGIIPICMHCKQIRDDKGCWNKLENYISEHSDAQFSHGICDKCAKIHFPECTPHKLPL